MPYQIKYKSQNSCLIKLAKNKAPRGKKRASLSLIVMGIIAVMIGVPVLVIMIAFLFIGVVLNKRLPAPTDFEIEFNRPKNRMTVRNTGQVKPKEMLYPLDCLKGFGFHQIKAEARRGPALAALFFEFDDRIYLQNGETDSPLLRDAEKITEVDREVFWQVPIQKGGYIIPVADAVDIMRTMNHWLAQSALDIAEAEHPLPDEPTPEPEVFRDFRDME